MMIAAPANTRLGVGLNVMASIAFAALYGYTGLLASMDGQEIFGWRVVLTVPGMLLFIILSGCWAEVTAIIRRLAKERLLWLTRLISGSLLGFQLWLFMWAPVNGFGLDVSLGYFLLPLTMVVVGRIVFKDRMSPLQWCACLCATLGVSYQLLVTDTVAWPTLAVCLGYPGYFALRRITHTNNLGGMWLDMSVSLPISIYFILAGSTLHDTQMDVSGLLLLTSGLGLISTLALVLQTLSAPHLNLTLFGLLIYVEPVFLVAVSLLLGESINPDEWPLYIAIGLAVMMLAAEGLATLKASKRRSAS